MSGSSPSTPEPTTSGYTALRYFNASGADLDGHHGEDRRVEAHLIPLIFQAAIGRRPAIKICGTDYPTRDGTCVRDYVHVLDLAQAHQRAVETLEPGVARVYNIGSGDGTTVLEVLRACEEIVGQPIPHEMADRRPGDPAVLVASPQRLADELGWSPRYSEHPHHCRDGLAVASVAPGRLRCSPLS